jgi:small-conductance mechanosensitive channel
MVRKTKKEDSKRKEQALRGKGTPVQAAIKKKDPRRENKSVFQKSYITQLSNELLKKNTYLEQVDGKKNSLTPQSFPKIP